MKVAKRRPEQTTKGNPKVLKSFVDLGVIDFDEKQGCQMVKFSYQKFEFGYLLEGFGMVNLFSCYGLLY
jgi:hypothetical protein